MKANLNDLEFFNIIKDILDNKKFNKLRNVTHHSTNRFEHSLRVSYFSYKIAKKLNLDYISTARAGLLHDFFLNNYNESKGRKLMLYHPLIAVYNSKKYFNINEKEENIIKSHMFPVNFKYKPKYIESHIVWIVDDIACLYERTCGCKWRALLKTEKLAFCIFLLFGI